MFENICDIEKDKLKRSLRFLNSKILPPNKWISGESDQEPSKEERGTSAFSVPLNVCCTRACTMHLGRKSSVTQAVQEATGGCPYKAPSMMGCIRKSLQGSRMRSSEVWQGDKKSLMFSLNFIVCVCVFTCVEVRGQLCVVNSPLQSLRRFSGLSSACQA